MISFRPMRRLFFSSPKVINAVDRATRKVLRHFGALVRKTDKWSMSYRIHMSKPGDPPHSHVGTLRRGRYGVMYGYDFYHRSVVIGPCLIPGRGDTNALPALEVGGVSLRVKRDRKKPPGPVYIMARPHTRPALKKMLPILPQLWRDSAKP